MEDKREADSVNLSLNTTAKGDVKKHPKTKWRLTDLSESPLFFHDIQKNARMCFCNFQF